MVSAAWAIVRLYGLRYAVAVPLVAAVVAGAVAAGQAPGELAVDSVHDDYSAFFGTAAQLIGALVIALVVEARAPFSRTGTVAARFVAASSLGVVTLGAFASILGLSPDLSNCVYEISFVLSWAGIVGGLAAVALLGVSLVSGTLRRVDKEELERLKQLGDLGAADELLRRYDSW